MTLESSDEPTLTMEVMINNKQTNQECVKNQLSAISTSNT